MTNPLDQLMSLTLPAAAKTVSVAMPPQPISLADVLHRIARHAIQSAASVPQPQGPLPNPPMVRPGAYIVPADVVAAKGNGSTQAGAQAYAQLGGELIQGPGDGRSDSVPALGPDGPIALSNGEVHISPLGVAMAGGPQILDRDVLDTRNSFGRHLDVLPPPRQ